MRTSLIMFVFFGLCISLAQSPSDALERGFQNPPDSAKPRVWWHWMSGNVTKEGIKADLEWMKRAGIGGFQNFDAGLNTPQIVEKRLVYMTPEWKDAFKYAATLADQLGLEMAIAGSPGWSESGGPWVTAGAGDEEVRLERDSRGRRTARSPARCRSRRPRPARTRTSPRGRGGFGGRRSRPRPRRNSTPTARWSPIARRTATCRWRTCSRR